MSQLIRPLRHCPRLHHRAAEYLPPLLSPGTTLDHRPYYRTTLLTPPPHRHLHQRPRGLRFPNAPPSYDLQHRESDGESSEGSKSRNQKKREARGAVRWGMELASFSVPQIRRILRVASLEEDVFQALMLVKRLGPDVRDGKRRQFNYIGKLLREVEPELMDALIQATKDGDQSRLQALAVSDAWSSNDVSDYDDDDDYKVDYELEEEGSSLYASIVVRWLNGLINNNVEISKEVYSIHDVDFDRQELRKLVRQAQSSQDQPDLAGGNKAEGTVAAIRARKSLTRLLCSLAKHSPSANT